MSRAEPTESGVALRGGTHAIAGYALSYTASTGATLAGAGGHFLLQLRGIALTHVPRATYARPDYLGRRCSAEPCRWSVVRGPASYEFRAFLVDLRRGKSASRSAPVRSVWARPAQPHALKLLFNGQNLPTTPLDGSADNYDDLTAGSLRVEARWTGDARGSGYYVLISTTEPVARDYVRCSTGTSCLVPGKVQLLANQEMSWSVKLLTVRGNKVVAGFKVCLAGHP